MTVPVVADADTLYPAATRGLLIQLDQHGLIHLFWSPLLLDEAMHALARTGRRPSLANARAHEALLREVLPHAMVATRDVQSQFRAVQRAVHSAKDLHVAACAYWLVAARIHPGTRSVVLATGNQRDFSKRVLSALGITLLKPDALLLELIQAQPTGFLLAFQALLDSLPSRPSWLVLADKLRRDGQTQTVRALLAAQRAQGQPCLAGKAG